jgi:hypothetical protein
MPRLSCHNYAVGVAFVVSVVCDQKYIGVAGLIVSGALLVLDLDIALVLVVHYETDDVIDSAESAIALVPVVHYKAYDVIDSAEFAADDVIITSGPVVIVWLTSETWSRGSSIT